MKFTLDKNAAHNAIALASKAIASKSPKPIMEMLMIEAEEGCVKFRGTNSVLDITTWVEADVKEAGSCCVNRLVTSMLPNFKSGDIEFSLKKMLTLKQGKSTNRFAVAATDEYPSLPNVKGEFVSIDPKTISRAFEVCAVALSDRADMPATQGYNVNPHNNAISTADGDQVVYYDLELVGNITIPSGNHLASILGELRSAKELWVAFGGGWTGFKSPDWKIYVNQKEGQFPDLSKVIDKALSVDPSLVLEVNVSEVRRILSKAVALSDAALKSGRLHHLAIDRRNNTVKFEMNAQDMSALDEVLEEFKADGLEEYRILVHPKLLDEIFAVTNSETLTFHFYKPTQPFLVIDPNENYKYIQVAMKLDEKAEQMAKAQEEREKETEATGEPEIEEDEDY